MASAGKCLMAGNNFLDAVDRSLFPLSVLIFVLLVSDDPSPLRRSSSLDWLPPSSEFIFNPDISDNW